MKRGFTKKAMRWFTVEVKIYRKPTIAMTIVKTILAQMPAVRQPQAKFLDTLFATILALRGHVTVRNLSRYCDYSKRALQRQFRAAFDWAGFHRLTLQTVWREADEWIEVQDASFIPKSGKNTPGLGSFFNGCAGRPERGLELSTLALVNVTRGYAVTRHVCQTPAGTKATGDESRLTWYARQVLGQRATLPPSVTLWWWTEPMPNARISMRWSARDATSSPNCATMRTVIFCTPRHASRGNGRSRQSNRQG